MSKTLNVGLVGAGWIGKVHAEAYARVAMGMNLPANSRVRLHTVADIAEPLAQAVARDYGFTNWTRDWQDLIDNPEIDVVDICVQNSLHRDIAVAAAKAGKHILCEKPLANSLAESEAMVAAVQESGVTAMIAFNYRRVPALVFAHQLLQSGHLGRVYHFRSVFTQDFAADPLLPMSWRFTPAAGGGSLVTMGSHVLDTARWLVGEVSELTSRIDTYVPDRPLLGPDGRWDGTSMGATEVEDTAHLLLQFENGATGMVQTSWLSHGRKHHFELEINAAEGSLFFNSERLNELQICETSDPQERRGFKTIYVGENHPYGEVFGLKSGMGIGIKETFALQAYDLLSAIASSEEVRPTFFDGLQVDRIIRAAYESARTGRWTTP